MYRMYYNNTQYFFFFFFFVLVSSVHNAQASTVVLRPESTNTYLLCGHVWMHIIVHSELDLEISVILSM